MYLSGGKGGGMIGSEKHSERHPVCVLGLVISPKSLEKFSNATLRHLQMCNKYSLSSRPPTDLAFVQRIPGNDEPIFEYRSTPSRFWMFIFSTFAPNTVFRKPQITNYLRRFFANF